MLLAIFIAELRYNDIIQNHDLRKMIEYKKPFQK